MNPYETNPNKIPLTDPYADLPLYGRYTPGDGDFEADPAYFNLTTPAALQYWKSVLEKCDQTTCLYDNPFGGRDVFAVGGLIIKSAHLKGHNRKGDESKRDYSVADLNEVAALELVRKTLSGIDIEVPKILFADKIDGYDILIQSRIPGVALNVAWPYLSAAQKSSFKTQARKCLSQIRTIRCPSIRTAPSYISPDLDPIANRDITLSENNLLFPIQDQDEETDLRLMHNDFTVSNIIVNADKIVGIIDWEVAGYFSWWGVRSVHEQFRAPKREDYAHLNDLPEEELTDMVFWNDLYAIDP